MTDADWFNMTDEQRLARIRSVMIGSENTYVSFLLRQLDTANQRIAELKNEIRRVEKRADHVYDMNQIMQPALERFEIFDGRYVGHDAYGVPGVAATCEVVRSMAKEALKKVREP